MREKLATIQKIEELIPIPNADKIEVAKILGWECVVKKGEFKVGDWCVYIEIDSVLPSDNPYFEFMKDRKYRVKTIKLRGQISQGLVCPLSILKPIHPDDLRSGIDVTKELDIKHYEELINEVEVEPEVQSKSKFVKWLKRHIIYRKYFSKKLKGGFPSFIKKTDEERIQNHPKWLRHEQPVYITEKIDGTSATYFIKKVNFFNTIFGVCSRGVYRKTRDNSYYWQVAIKYDIEKKLKKIRKDNKCDFCIQGEIIGPKIQKNKYNVKELKFYVFNIFNITTQVYLPFAVLVAFCEKYGLEMVPTIIEKYTELLPDLSSGMPRIKPLIHINKSFKLPHTVDEIVKMSKGLSALNPEIPREGIVIRNIFNQSELSFKCINPEFLLRYGE